VRALGSEKFRTGKAFLFQKKASAQNKAKSLRAAGYRAKVEPSIKFIQKRSPQLKWACLRGQRRK
jgi:hypothetical protein